MSTENLTLWNSNEKNLKVDRKKVNSEVELKAIELFAGAGGLALGVEKAGFNTIGLIEIDKNACNTLKLNRPNWNVINENIANISLKNLEDTRGTLFYHYALFLKQLQPKMFLFENVKGLLSHDKGKTHETIINVFKEEGYTIYEKVLNAWDYGVAQKRERLIIVGIRNDLINKLNFLFPTPHKYKPVLRDILLDCPESKGIAYSEYKKNI